MNRPLRLAAASALALSLGGCMHIYEPHPSSPAAGGAAGGAPAGAAAQARAEQGPLKPWDVVLKDSKPIDGYLKLHRKRDNSLLLELRPDQLDKDLGLVMHFSRGLGVFNVQQGLPLSDVQLMRFRRTGDKVYLVQMNPRFTADAGSPMRVTVEGNVGNSIVAALPVLSENKESKAVLVDLGSFLLSDYPGIADGLKFSYGGKPVAFDKERSYVGRALAFPRNDEIDAELTFRANDFPVGEAAGVSDYRSIPIGVRYSFFALPEKPMAPRYADDRVGYFTNSIRDFSRDRDYDPYLHFINRWRLEKKEPGAALSEPVQPIVYYIDTSVPREYRKYVKEAIEAWNKAFEAAGFKNAIVAREAPENDSTWSAEDIRYSTVRWTAAQEMGYAIGPSETDPRTGEILNADILISSEFVRGWAITYSTEVASEGRAQPFGGDVAPGAFAAGNPFLRFADRLCTLEQGMTQQLGFQFAALAALGVIDGGKPMPEQFLGEALREVTMHEVGHTLGLRHNMKASSAIPYDKLNDKGFTTKNGLTLSVMDYAPPNIALDPKEQGSYYSLEVGSYDLWAIRYGYAQFAAQSLDAATAAKAAPGAAGVTAPSAATRAADADKPELVKIASLAADPMHTYGTDEDTHFIPFVTDPNSNTFDLGSDPLRYAADRATLAARVQSKLESRLIGDGESYQRLRGAFGMVLAERFYTLVPATKVVGGIYFSRDHKGDPDGRSPFTPVSAARQREAVKLIVDNAFAEGAVKVDPALLNKLAPTRQADWSGQFAVFPIDYPIHNAIAARQNLLLSLLLASPRLARMIDNQVRMPAGQEAYTVAELMETLTGAIWSELGTGRAAPRTIDSFRRNLQRAYVDQLVRIMLDARPAGNAPGALPPQPEDARSLARYQLVRLDERIKQTLGTGAAAGGGLDTTTRAHLMETDARIGRALAASVMVPR